MTEALSNCKKDILLDRNKLVRGIHRRENRRNNMKKIKTTKRSFDKDRIMKTLFDKIKEITSNNIKLKSTEVDYGFIKDRLNKQIDVIRETKSYVVCNANFQSIRQNLDTYINDHNVITYPLNKWIKDMQIAYPKGSAASRFYSYIMSPTHLSIQFVESVFNTLKDMGYTIDKGSSFNDLTDYLSSLVKLLKSDFLSLVSTQEELIMRWYVSTMIYINDVDVIMKQWVEKDEVDTDRFGQLPSAIWMNILADKIILNPRNLKQLIKLHAMISALSYIYQGKEEPKKEQDI